MIPRTIHRIWVGGPMPAELQGFGATWQRHHPSWRFRLWDERTLRWWLCNQDLFDRAREIAPDNVGQLRADIARYEILHRLGGVYVDCDFECLRAIDELIEGVEAFAAWEHQNVWVNNAIMGAEPDHPFLARAIAELPASVERNRGARPNVMTGPQFITKLYRKDPQGLTIFDQELFYPYNFRELDRKDEEFPDAYGVHHWFNKRKARGAARAHL